MTYKSNMPDEPERPLLNPNDTKKKIQRCCELLSGDWLVEPERFVKAEDELNELAVALYTTHDHKEVTAALAELTPDYKRMVIADRLHMIELVENLNSLDMFEVDDDELQAAIDSGEAQLLTLDQVKRRMH